MAVLNGAKLTWFGHSTFLLETAAGTRIMLDPWLTGNPATPAELADPGDIDIIAVSHGHSDHTGDVIRLAAEKQPQAVVAMVELAGYFAAQGVENTVGMNKGGSNEIGRHPGDPHARPPLVERRRRERPSAVHRRAHAGSC